MGQEIALVAGADEVAVGRVLADAHEQFLTSGETTERVRPVVADSWRRSLAAGVAPDQAMAPVGLLDDLLVEARAAHPLTAVMPVVRRLLVEDATDAGLLVAVSDAAGRLLYVEGAADLLRRAEAMHFMPGADWSERLVGTNAPGTALAVGRPVQVLGHEHLSRVVTDWSCSAAPVRDPDTGAVLGVIDVTGGPQVATGQAMSLVRATAAAAESELRIARLAAHAAPRHDGGRVRPRLEVLGRAGGVLSGEF